MSDPVPTKICGGPCKARQPISNFGMCRSRKDGRNLYCKGCVGIKATTSRQQLREYKQAQKNAQKKPSPPLQLTLEERIVSAIQVGAVTEEQITRTLKLGNLDARLADMVLSNRTLSTCEVNGKRVYNQVDHRNGERSPFCHPCSPACQQWIWHGVMSSDLCAPRL